MKDGDKIGYREVQRITGMTMGTIYSMVSRREIPYYRLGPRLVVFSRAELEQWFAKRHVAPKQIMSRGRRGSGAGK